MKKLTVHKDAQNTFLTKDMFVLAANSGSTFDPINETITINYLSHFCTITKQGYVCSPTLTLTENEKTLMLYYLSNSSGLPFRNTWLSFLELPEGEHHYAPFKVEGLQPLANTFAHNLDEFAQRCERLGGIKTTIADCSYIFWPFPKFPVLIGMYDADEEFAAKAIILFDAVAPTYLTTAQLWVLGIEIVQRLTLRSTIAYL